MTAAAAGICHALLFVMMAVLDLRDDAPSLAVGSNVLLLVAGILEMVTFGVALVWPVRGVLIGAPALVTYGGLMVIENRFEAARHVVVPPPPGMAPAPYPSAAVQMIAFAVFVIGVPLPGGRRAGARTCRSLWGGDWR